MRNRLQKSARCEFLIDLTQLPEEIEKQRDRFFALQYQDAGNSGIEIGADNEVHGGGPMSMKG